MMRRSILIALAGISALALPAAPASAALVAVVGGACNITTSNPDAIACSGAWSGNLNNNASIADLNAALDILVGNPPGYNPDLAWTTALDNTKLLFTAGTGTTVNFASTLYGQHIMSMHFGNAGTGLGNRTILYLFDFGVAGANSVDVGIQGWSNTLLIPAQTSVPEPGTWAMMLLGFAGAGFAIRRSRRRDGKLLQLA